MSTRKDQRDARIIYAIQLRDMAVQLMDVRYGEHPVIGDAFDTRVKSCLESAAERLREAANWIDYLDKVDHE